MTERHPAQRAPHLGAVTEHPVAGPSTEQQGAVGPTSGAGIEPIGSGRPGED